MKPRAMMPKMTNTWSAWFSTLVFISSEASATPMTDAMVVFFVNAMSVLPSGTMAPRRAWGKMM